MFLLKWFASSPPPSDTVTIMDMPDLVMRNILKDVDLISILKLRKVCHAFRNYIDDASPKPDTKIRRISVTLYNDSIYLNLVGKTYVKYVDQGDYCTVEWNKYTENLKKTTKNFKYHQNFLDVFFNDFSTILQIIKSYFIDLDISIDEYHYVRYTKKPFWLLGCCRSRSEKWKYSGDPDTTMLQLFENYQKIMNFFDAHPMTVKSLKIIGLGSSQISQILSKIKTEELRVDNIFGGADSLDFEEIVKLENWKSIRTFHVWGITVAHPVTLFIDKPSLTILIDEIFPEEVRLILKTFRNNSSMQRWRFFIEDHLDVMDSLVRELGRPSWEGEWYFNIPGSEKLLFVRFLLYGDLLLEYIDKDRTPGIVNIY